MSLFFHIKNGKDKNGDSHEQYESPFLAVYYILGELWHPITASPP